MWHVGVMNCFHIRQWVAKDYVKIYLRFTFSLFHSVGRSLARAYTHQHTQCRQFVCLVAVYAVRCALQLTYCCNVRCIKLTPSWHTLIMCVVTYLLLSLSHRAHNQNSKTIIRAQWKTIKSLDQLSSHYWLLIRLEIYTMQVVRFFQGKKTRSFDGKMD